MSFLCPHTTTPSCNAKIKIWKKKIWRMKGKSPNTPNFSPSKITRYMVIPTSYWKQCSVDVHVLYMYTCTVHVRTIYLHVHVSDNSGSSYIIHVPSSVDVLYMYTCTVHVRTTCTCIYLHVHVSDNSGSSYIIHVPSSVDVHVLYIYIDMYMAMNLCGFCFISSV